MNSTIMPLVSVIIPIRNEERTIMRCLDSVLQTDYPKDHLEILVVEGLSTDRTARIVLEYSKQYSFIRLLNNPKCIQAAALNVGLQEANGEIIVRMDAHTTYAPDYIRQCITALKTTGAANVGGMQKPIGTGYVSGAIAAAYSSPFAAGDAKYRYSDEKQWVDTVYLGAWRAQTLIDIGGFDEDWPVNEDYELNYRLRKKGGKILLSPQIKCRYYVRGSFPKLARQYLGYGFWKVKTVAAHPASLRWRQLACPTFVASLTLSAACISFSPKLTLIVPFAYAMSSLIASFCAAARRGFRYLPALPLIFAIIHMCWGMGFWAGLAVFGLPRLYLMYFGSLVNTLLRPANDIRTSRIGKM
jgi:glycosyltransferase involved in cell wall biosynthesis